MSIKMMTAVFDRYPNGGGEMLLALSLADHAHDDGTHIFPSVQTLAKKTRQSERSVQYQLRNMEQSGWLVLVSFEFGGRGKCREYRINPDWIKGAEIAPFPKGCNSEHERVQSDAGKGATGDIKGATAIAPEPSVTKVKPSVTKNTRSKSAAGLGLGIVLPDWIPAGKWDDFVAMRKEIKKPITEKGKLLAISRLAEYKAQGHSVVAILDKAILNSNCGLFPPNGYSQVSQPKRSSPHTGFKDRDYDRGVNPDGSF